MCPRATSASRLRRLTDYHFSRISARLRTYSSSVIKFCSLRRRSCRSLASRPSEDDRSIFAWESLTLDSPSCRHPTSAPRVSPIKPRIKQTIATIGQKPASAGPASAGRPADVPKINNPTPRHTPTMASTLVLWCGGYSPLSERSVFITVLVVVDHDSCQRQCRRFLAGRGPLSPRIGRHGDRYSDTDVSEIKTPRRQKNREYTRTDPLICASI
jgi:hypothetical protein